MSLPDYQKLGYNSPLTANYISKTVGCNTNLDNPNNSVFLATYPRQGYVRSAPPAPKPSPAPTPAPSPVPKPTPAPSPAIPLTRFYKTNLYVNAPYLFGEQFPDFTPSTPGSPSRYNVFLDNYFMKPPSYYLNDPNLTYFKTDTDQNDKGFLFILSDDDDIPYYITNDFNTLSDQNTNNKFIIAKRKSLTSYYSSTVGNATFTFTEDNTNANKVINNLYTRNFFTTINLTLFYNFRLYNTNLRVIKNNAYDEYETEGNGVVTSDLNTIPGVFESRNFSNYQPVFFDNYSKIPPSSGESFDSSFYSNVNDLNISNLQNLYVYDTSGRAFYLTVHNNLESSEVFVNRKFDPSLSPDAINTSSGVAVSNNDLSSRIYYKIVDDNTKQFVTNLVDLDITFNKLIPNYSISNIDSFRNPTNNIIYFTNPPVPAPATIVGSRPVPAPVAIVGSRPVPAPVAIVGSRPVPAPAPIIAGVYATNLRIVERNTLATAYTTAFIEIVPNDAVNGYYQDAPFVIPTITSCSGLTNNKCYGAIPTTSSNNKIGYDYSINTAFNNLTATPPSQLLSNTRLRAGWANVLSNGPNSGIDRTPQPVRDQRSYLSNTLNSNTIQLYQLTTRNIFYSNFTDKTVYYSNIDSNLRQNTPLTQSQINSNLYVIHEDGWYFKIKPQDTATDYKFKFFWRIENHTIPPNRTMFVTLSNSSPSTRFVKSDDSNVKINSSYTALTSFPTSTW